MNTLDLLRFEIYNYNLEYHKKYIFVGTQKKVTRARVANAFSIRLKRNALMVIPVRYIIS